MSTTVSDITPLECLAGIEPSADSTSLSTPHYTWSENIRFVGGKPEKIGGYTQQEFNGDTIDGLCRSIFSTVFSNRVQTVFGTHKKIYSSSGGSLTNITPLKTTSTAAANSLATLYGTLSSDPISTTSGSKTIRITDSEYSRLKIGDTVTLSGATDTGGILAATLNAAHTIRDIGSGYYDIAVSTAASSTATGGGASVVRATGIMNVTKSSHGLTDGERIKIEGASTTGGVTDTVINVEHIIRNVTTNTFDVMTSGTATSSVSSGGGASTVYYQQIDNGNENETFGQGYGMGLYGAGLYGTALLSSSGKKLPTTWFFDKYGDYIIMNRGNGTPVYRWDGSINSAPVAVTNAPTEVNYSFISDNILVTFGSGGVVNKIFSSAQGDITNWTASSNNAVFEDNIEGAGRLMTHANANGTNIIFTEQRCYTMRFVGFQSGVWQIKPLEPIGIISPMARVVVQGNVFWMGNDNFYMWRGGSVEVIPSNSSAQSTMLRYVFDNINFGQKNKFFAWYNKKHREVWFHYASGQDTEPNRVVVVNLNDYSWYPLEMYRTAAEYPEVNLSLPRLADNNSNIFKHETTYDANETSMPWSLQFNTRRQGGKKVVGVVGIIPDSIQTGNININVKGRQWPQSTTNTCNNDYTCTATQERIPTTISGRFYQYTLSGDALGQNWQMGDWFEEVQIQGNN